MLQEDLGLILCFFINNTEFYIFVDYALQK